MGNEPPFSAANGPQEGSNYDEIFMQHSLQFSDSLKDLKNLRKQLYSAAEYFESSYGENEHKTLVIETLKDYVSKALISSVDHLGSVACKLNSFLDEKVDEFSTTKLRFSCMEQKLQTCQEIVDRSGLLQQSLIILTPKQHKRYMISAAETQPAVPKPRPRNKEHNLCPQDDLQVPKNGDCFPHPFQALPSKQKYMKRPPKISWTDASPNPLNFSFTRVASTKEVGKRSVSPLKFGLNRSGSVNRSVSPLMRFGSAVRRSISPSTSNIRQRCPSEPRRAISMSINPERNSAKDMQNYARKSKNLLTAFLSRHGHGQGSRKAGIPSKYHDDR
ncbi:protein ABIL2-like [Lycium barbarum]|uniref:protein ABIL2-like n=1 Tax=Lycium barbarum TaxID=112863 RepID=UPI00293EB6AE|nr:protein ABIL2-like [Lycium barbarum]XP_060206806.1 protein ABIL2-like [Lycium barbarum]XP_060206807.1 protein ABIL2-like [Lycium barbarum]